MGNQTTKSFSETSYSLEIANFSEKKDSISTETFLSGGCEWYVVVGIRDTFDSSQLWLHLSVQNPNSLQTGWKRSVNFHFELLNESGKVLYTGNSSNDQRKPCIFCAQLSSWSRKTLPFSKLREEGFLENNKLIVKVYVQVLEVTHQGKSTENEMFEVEGFEVISTKVSYVAWLLFKHPDIAKDFKPKTKEVKTAYMNLLISLVLKLGKPPTSFSKAELENAQNELNELIESGFKLDWLKTKLEEVSLKRKNALADGSRVQDLEERINNLELTLSDLKGELKSEKAKSTTHDELLSFYDIL